MLVLVVDDHPSIGEGLRTVLSHEFPITCFQVATSSESAVGLAASQSWSLIISDLSLPGRDGPELIGDLARAAPGARILVFSAHSEHLFGVRALRAGAHGYVTKDQPLDRLIEAIHRLLAGKRFISPELADELITALSEGEGPPHERLSDREMQVLRMLGGGLPIGGIARQLHLSEKTVSTYRSRMLEKLHLSSTADLIRYAIENHIE